MTPLYFRTANNINIAIVPQQIECVVERTGGYCFIYLASGRMWEIDEDVRSVVAKLAAASATGQ